MKFKALILAAAVIFSTISFTACSSSENEEKTTEETEADEQEEEENTEISEETKEYYSGIKKYGLPQLEEPEEGETIAIIDTNYGNITVRFFEEIAPLAVENFIGLANKGYYDGVIFHRVINNFMIQGGDPTGTGMGGESYFGEDFGLEVSSSLKHFRGALAMANTGQPNSNSSQFYIVQSKDIGDSYRQMLTQALNEQDEEMQEGTGIYVSDAYPTEAINEYLNNGGYPSLDGSYTVFGQVIEGMETVDAIAAVETDSSDKPLEDVIINSVTISEYGL